MTTLDLTIHQVCDYEIKYPILKEFMTILENNDLYQYIYKISSIYVLVAPIESNHVWHLTHEEYTFAKEHGRIILGFLLMKAPTKVEYTWVRDSVIDKKWQLTSAMFSLYNEKIRPVEDD